MSGDATWGARVSRAGGVQFRTWAPTHAQLHLRLQGHDDLPMQFHDGWHELHTPLAASGSRYHYVLPDGSCVADPASLFQPEGVGGVSEVIDLSLFPWQHEWHGRPWHEAIIYELHVGAFTPQGTFCGVTDKLAQLAELGVTAIELMPVGAFAGQRNWGYDGVFAYAPASCYGRPEDLQSLVDAAHGHGIMVLLDVVYNHFGPEGNVLGRLAPGFFTNRHPTPWGKGFNFDGSEAVRRFFIDNALHWLTHYRLDGLRFDAVHAIADDSPRHIIDAIADTVRGCFPGRDIHLILENEHNEAQRLPRRQGKPVLFTAQWNDDMHHVLHTAVTGEDSGYYKEYRGDGDKLSRVLAQGFAFQGEVMHYAGRPRGQPSGHLPPTAFVSFIQNHDQVGNRAFGERITALAPLEAVRAAAAIYLLAPQIPMLFMGEEWDAAQPFTFFCDFSDELARAVAQGRRNEFARFPEFADPAHRARIPDPSAAATFNAAKLRWQEREQPPHRATLEWYRQLIALRKREIVPLLPLLEHGGEVHGAPPNLMEVHWHTSNADTLQLQANLAPHSAPASQRPTGRILWQQGDWLNDIPGPWAVRWSINR